LNVQSQNIKKDATESLSGQHESASTLPKEQQTSGSLVDRLLDRAYSMHRKDALCEEAANEIERLRHGAVAGRETVCPHVRGTVTQHCSLNFTLTAEEREAIEYFANFQWTMLKPYAATLRNLLERLK
jgi:hypothetical protein